MNLELHKSKNLLKILNTAIDAGKEIQKVYKKSFNVEIKDDNSPITEADIKSNNLILNRLKSFSPNVPILSEESLVGWQERKNWNWSIINKMENAEIEYEMEKVREGKQSKIMRKRILRGNEMSGKKFITKLMEKR